MDEQSSSPSPPPSDPPAAAVTPSNSARTKPGYRLGPFYFVPELRSSGNDPWAHRKGEPRMFALFWSAYLMVASLTTLFAVSSTSIPSSAQYAFGSASLLTMVALGCTLLWPLTRLSQAPPARPLAATLGDMVVLLLPLQVIVWPLPILTQWRWEIAAGLALVLASWTALIGAVVAWGTASRDGLTRIVAMGACLALVGFGPALSGWWWATHQARTPPIGLMMLSPFTAIWQLIDAPSGWTPRMDDARRLGVALPFLPASVLWCGLLVWGRSGRPRDETPDNWPPPT